MREAKETTTPEDRFFGVRTTFGKDAGTAGDSDGTDDDLQVEVIDDRPPEDQRPAAKVAPDSDDDEDDDELANYSEKVQKRIKKLSFEKHELRRQKEEAERLREEAVNAAKVLYEKTSQQDRIIKTSEEELVRRFKQGAEFAIEKARAAYREAYEKGDTDKVIEAQEALIQAQAEARQASDYEREFTARKQQASQQRPAQPPPKPTAPKPSEKAMEWAKSNPWFGSNEHKDMTALAYGVHEKLIRDEGYDPNSDEYFEAIDKTMRARFPDYFNDDDGTGRDQPTSTHRKPSTVVAPGGRNNGVKPRKVKLTATQVALAKRLGITTEQYAKQLAKEM